MISSINPEDHGTKFAVEGLSEALHFNLEPLGIRVRIVESGMVKTDFGGRSFDFAMEDNLTVYVYAPTAQAMVRLFGKLAANPSAPEVRDGYHLASRLRVWRPPALKVQQGHWPS